MNQPPQLLTKHTTRPNPSFEGPPVLPHPHPHPGLFAFLIPCCCYCIVACEAQVKPKRETIPTRGKNIPAENFKETFGSMPTFVVSLEG